MGKRLTLWGLIALCLQTTWAMAEIGTAIGPANGAFLLGELHCVNCHQPAQAKVPYVQPRQAPVLAEVASRVSPNYIAAFLADPQKVKPGTPMPDLLHGLAEGEQAQAAQAIASYLQTLGKPMETAPVAASESLINQGQRLYHTVGCVACHQPFQPPPAGPEDDEAPTEIPVIKSPSVPLGNLAAKTTVNALAEFLLDPLKSRPSGRMPSMKLTPAEARAIAAYLLREQADRKSTARAPGLALAVYEGKSQELIDPVKHKLNPKLEAVTMGFAPEVNRTSEFSVRLSGQLEIPSDGKITLAFAVRDALAVTIDGKPVSLKPGGRGGKTYEAALDLKKGFHDIQLVLKQGAGDATLSATWLLPGEKQHRPIPATAVSHSGFQIRLPNQPALPNRIEEGRNFFANLGCIACHDIGKDIPAVPATELAELDPAKAGGCLDAQPAKNLPRFAFSAEQKSSLAKAIVSLKTAAPAEPKIVVHNTLQALNCYACHARQGSGGPDAGRAAYFTSQIEIDLGDEGRLPPHLNEVGAKLTPTALEKVFTEGASVRPYLATRMPQFGQANVQALPAALLAADADRIKPLADAQEFTATQVDAGRRLVGTNGLGCVNCHGWGKHKSLGPPAINLLAAAQRLNRAYVHEYFANPAKLRPGTRMPGFWPDGQSALKEVADGDLVRQTDAIWAYLSMGERAAPPVGMNESDQNLLVPSGEPIVFRTFIREIGVHAITVGFRQRSHVAFDALRVRMAIAWSGDFLNAGPAWNGRGGNFSEPLSKEVVPFAPGSSFAVLESQTTPWPVMDMKARSAPEGWKFRGYRYEADRTPTFLYRFDQVEIEETPQAQYSARGGNVMRRFVLAAPQAVGNLYLRVAVGEKIESDGSGIFTVDGKARYRMKSSAAPIRRTIDQKQELLVPIEWSEGAAGRKSASVEVEVTW